MSVEDLDGPVWAPVSEGSSLLPSPSAAEARAASSPDGPRRPTVRSGKILLDYLNLLGSRYLGILLGVARGLLVPGLLDPSAYGTYKGLMLIPTFVRAGHLGAVSGLNRQIPFYRGSNEPQKLREALRVAYTFSIGSALLASVVLAFFAVRFDDVSLRVGLWIFLVYVVADQQTGLQETYLLGFEKFGAVARLRLFKAALGTGLAILGAWWFGLTGLIVATTVTGLIALGAFRWSSGLGFPGLSLRRQVVKELLEVGAPLLVTGLLYNVLFSVDRIVILRFLGTEAMGYYALAVNFVGYINDISTLFSRVVFPRMMTRVGAQAPLDDIKRYLHLPMAGTSYLFPVGIVFVHYGAYWIFRLAFPKYLPGSAALEILTFCVLPYTHALVYMNLIVAMKRQIAVFWVFPVSIVVTAALAGLAVTWGWGLEGIAAATAAGFLVFSALEYFYAETRLLGNPSPWPRFLRCYGPTLFVAVLIFGSEMVFASHRESVGRTLTHAAAILALYAPVLAWGWRNDREFRDLISAARRARVAF